MIGTMWEVCERAPVNDLYSMTLVTFEYRLFAYQLNSFKENNAQDLLHLFLPCTQTTDRSTAEILCDSIPSTV